MLLAGNIAQDGLRLEVLHNLNKFVFDVKIMYICLLLN